MATTALKRTKAMLKRFLDIVIAVAGLLLVLPFFSVIWLVLRMSSAGCEFVQEERVGKDNKTIYLYKLRGGEGENV